jgi:multidrug resistance efflux pump
MDQQAVEAALAQLQQQIQTLQANNNVLQGQVTTAQATAQQAAAAQAATMAAATQPTVYALSPAAIDPNNIIDYKSQSGLKIHETATKALPIEFDLNWGNL